MINKKNRGFALVYVTVTLAIAMAIFFRYAMNARARKAIALEKYKLSDIEDSVKRAMSIGLNEGYIIDQMIVNKKDYKNSSGVDTYFNIGDYKDYFLVKDKEYLTFIDTDPINNPEKIWQVNPSKSSNINNIWKKVKKKNTGGVVSTRYPGYYAGGTNEFEFGTFANDTRFSKGGYFIKSIQALNEANEYCGSSTNKGIIYKVGYSEFSQANSENDDICYIIGGVKTEGSQKGASNVDSNIDPIESYLSHPGEQIFIIDVRKDIAYTVGTGTTTKIVAAFEAIAQFELKYSASERDTKNPEIKMLNYEINHIGP